MNAGLGVLAVAGGAVAGCVFAQWSSPPSRQVYRQRSWAALCGLSLVLGVVIAALLLAALIALLAVYAALRVGRDGLLETVTPHEMGTLAKGVLTVAISTSAGYVGLWAALGRRPALRGLWGSQRGAR